MKNIFEWTKKSGDPATLGSHSQLPLEEKQGPFSSSQSYHLIVTPTCLFVCVPCLGSWHIAMNDPSPKDDVISKVQAGGTHFTPHKDLPRTGKCVKKILLHLALLTVGMATVVTAERPVPTSTGVGGGTILVHHLSQTMWHRIKVLLTIKSNRAEKTWSSSTSYLEVIISRSRKYTPNVWLSESSNTANRVPTVAICCPHCYLLIETSRWFKDGHRWDVFSIDVHSKDKPTLFSLELSRWRKIRQEIQWALLSWKWSSQSSQ